MLNLRIYRGAFVPFALALVIVAFSFGKRPPPLPSPLAPDAFSSAAAIRDLSFMAATYPDRRPGSPDDRAFAAWIAQQFRADRFDTRVVRFGADTVDGHRTLETVIGTRPGLLNKAIVLVAHRDAFRPGSPAELSGSAALVELAQALGNRVTQRKLVFVSTSGGSGGDAGAAELARELGEPVDAVIVLGDLAGTQSRRPYVVPFSNGSQQAPLRLRRTVEAALQAQLGRSPGGVSTFDQFARLAFPLTVGEQGPLLADGLPAVLVQQSGELGPSPGERLAPNAQTRIAIFGQGVLAAIGALDAGPGSLNQPTQDILSGANVLPVWAVSLLVATLIIPALVTTVDGFARVRRRRRPVAVWFAWLGATIVPFLLAALFAALLGSSGLLHAAPSGPVTSRQLPLGTAGRAALVSVALVFVLAWLMRRAMMRRLGVPGAASAPGAATALLLTLCALAVIVWALNPYAAALLVLPLNLWLIATALEPAPPRRLAAALVLVAVLPLVFVMALDASRLSLGPISFAWMALLLLAGGHVGIGGLLLWSIAGGCLAAVIAIVARRMPEPPPEPLVTVRGPISYAGPGSLGGTDSALRT
jgi:hypothetical protein